jgi:hypothetical protein
VCKTQKGDICGAAVKGGGLVCKRHTNCPLPGDLPADFITAAPDVMDVEPTEPTEPESVVMEVESTETIEPEPVATEMDAQRQRDLSEPVLVLPDEAPGPAQVDETAPEMIEARLLDQEGWSTHRIANHQEMMRLLETTAVVDIDERQFRFLETKIRACFE